MTARELELTLALQALELRLLALVDTRLSAMWSALPPPAGSWVSTIVEKLPADEARQ